MTGVVLGRKEMTELESVVMSTIYKIRNSYDADVQKTA